MDLQEVEWEGEGTYWIVLAQNRGQVAGSLCAVMNCRVRQNADNFWNI